MYNPSFKILEIISCKKCGWFVTNPNEQLGDLNGCLNCGLSYKETGSILEKVEGVINGKIVTVEGNKY